MIAAALGRICQFGASLFGRGQHQSLVPQPAPLPPVTDWFPPEIDPVYPGLYQRKYEDGSENDIGVVSPDHWSGSGWSVSGSTPTNYPTNCRRPWRGLSKDPGAEK